MAFPAWRSNLATIGALMVRAKNELVRVPGAAIPGVLAPTIFFLGLNGVFGALTQLRGFSTGSYESFIVPVSMLQGAGFTGAAAGVNLARDIEQGWLDRLLVSPAPRWVLLSGTVLAASARALIPATFVLAIALALGAGWPGVDGLLITYLMVAAMAAVAACWGSFLALRFKSQSAAPLMQAGMMALILTTTAYAPLALLQWLAAEDRPRQPGDPGGRSGAAGLRRQRHLGRNLAGAAGAGRDAGGDERARPARDAPHRAVMGRRAENGTMRPEIGPSAAAVAEAERVLRQNWREGERDGRPLRATPQPSPGRYPWQWYWDSCFAAIVRRRFDPARARAELESLLSAQRPNGFIGHTIFWNRPVSLVRLAFYNVASRTSLQTETIQPPLLAWAWRIAVGDPALEPRIGAHIDWLAANRDLEGDGLLWIVQPDESGLDASPKFEPVWGRRANGSPASRCWCGATAGSASTRGGSASAAGRSSARRWSTRCGRSRCRRWAGPRRPRPWSSGSGTSGAGSSSTRRSRAALRPGVLTWASPGAAGPARSARGDRPAAGRGAPAERARVPDPGGAALGLRLGAELRARRRPRPDPPLLARPDLGQLGLDGLARACAGSATRRRPMRLADGLIGAVAREGLREYYDPRTGKGLGAKDFAWSALIAELAGPDEKGRGSYL